MNNKELQASRRLFFITVKDAAKYIGDVSERSWQRWETGAFNVPADVEDKMQALAEKRLAMIEAAEDLMTDTGADEADIAYYMSYAEYLADHKDATVLDWCLAQSVAAYFFGDGLATLS